MSSSSVGRSRSSGTIPATAAGKISPVSGKPIISTGKENSRASSRVRASTQKPTIKPMVRIDKNAVEESRADPRARKSTSSVPRGRSSSPSDFARVLTDMRRNSNSNPRVPVGVLQRKKVSGDDSGEKTSERCDLEKRVVGVFDKSGVKALGVGNSGGSRKDGVLGSGKRSDSERRLGRGLGESDGESSGNGKAKIRIVNCEGDETRGALSAVSRKRSDLGNAGEKSDAESGFKANVFDIGSGSRESKVLGKGKSSERENFGNKYPSKLHEKLAFLEGKVKRIASDIKKTKEMLDMNNPDASKTMLSDIQEKISGIEKAMGHVVRDDANAEAGLVEIDPNDVKVDNNKVFDATSSVKGLNAEDLEARLFPHHKLIRDRTLTKAASGNVENHSLKVEESKGAMNVVEKKVGSFDDNTITMEFLASLNEETAKNGEGSSEIQEADGAFNLKSESSMQVSNAKTGIDALLMADENLDEFDDQENVPVMSFEEEVDENLTYQLNDIGCKSATGGWFVSEGESVLLTHDDGSCSFYDIANCEEKTVYKPPSGISSNMWRDCWIIRAPGPDGCSGKYVIAASAGNSLETGFCSWDYYTKEIRAFHVEDGTINARPALAPLSNNTMHRRNDSSTFGNHQWWYKPCGPLIASTASCQRTVQIYDIRDGDQVMSWELQKPVLAMDYASPLQWRNRGKVVIAESDAVSLWDVSSLDSQALVTVSLSGRKISALHVNNTDAEIGGGVRQRVSSSEAEGNDGVFCTSDSINVLDFRVPSGIGLKIPKVGVHMQSAFSRGDSIYIGCASLRSMAKKQSSSQIHHLSMRQQKLVSTYALPETNAHYNFTALTQVWGNSNLVMGVCGLGLFVFDSSDEDGGMCRTVKECVGPDDMYSPSFDYASSRVLIVSRDRPACWKYLF